MMGLVGTFDINDNEWEERLTMNIKKVNCLVLFGKMYFYNRKSEFLLNVAPKLYPETLITKLHTKRNHDKSRKELDMYNELTRF